MEWQFWRRGEATGAQEVAPPRRRWRIFRPGALGWLGRGASAVLLAALILVPLGLFVWLVTSTDTFRVQAVTVVDARPHTVEAAEALTQEALTDIPFGQLIFFVDTTLIEQEITRALPQVRTAHVRRVLPGTLKVILQEKEPQLLFVSNGRYYLVDENGIPYEEARLDTLPGVVLPTVKNDDTQLTVTLGVPVASPELVSFILYLQENISDTIGAAVVELRIPSLAAREIHVLLANNWEVRFDVTRAAQDQLDILRRVVDTVITPEERDSLEYIDLRIRGRVYYKTRGEVVPAT